MNWTIPGTTLADQWDNADRVDAMFHSMFLAGGMVLSQVSSITGLEAYTIQNWVKRGFLAPPKNKKYDQEQVCRIITINMLKGALPLEKICSLMQYIDGDLTDESDDIVNDSDLYNYFVNLLAMMSGHFPDEDEIKTHIRYITDEFNEPRPGGRKRLALVLEIMLFTHYSANMRRHADELVQHLD